MEIEIVSATDVGLVREKNEDSVSYQQYPHVDVSVCIVADGVGGHAGGDIASQITVKTILKTVEESVNFASSNNNFHHNWLAQTAREAIQNANEIIRKQQRQDSYLSNMASTVVLLLQYADDIVIAHAGDSRCYFCEKNAFNQITEDHTLAQQMLNDGILDYEGFQKSHYHHVLNNGLGLYDEVNIAVHADKCRNKVILLCSDGLTDCINDDVIYSQIIESESLTICAESLIEQALKAGGIDNISLILFSCTSAGE